MKPSKGGTLKVTDAQLAGILGVSTRTLRDYRKAADWPCTRRGPYTEAMLAAVIRWARAKWESEVIGSAPAAPGSLTDKARARRIGFMADLAELELGKRRGALLDRGTVWATFMAFADAVRVSAEAFRTSFPDAVEAFNKLLGSQQDDLDSQYPPPKPSVTVTP